MRAAFLYRAELLKALGADGKAMPPEAAARLCGFAYTPVVIEESLVMTDKTEEQTGDRTRRPPPQAAEAPTAGLRFWRAESLKRLPREEDERRHAPPIEIANAPLLHPKDLCYELDADPGAPLIAWSRLWPFLRQALGSRRIFRMPDTRKVIRLLATGRPVLRIPRRLRRTWNPHAVVLLDRRDAMSPFLDDYDDVLRRLCRMRGVAGLRVLQVEALAIRSTPAAQPDLHGFAYPRRAGDGWEAAVRYPLRLPPSGNSVLALGDLGQYPADFRMALWLSLGRRLRRRAIVPWALCPCPHSRWSPAMADAWNVVCWDRGQRMPAGGVGHRARPLAEADRVVRQRKQVEELLALMAPAVRVERGLLRDLRFLRSASELDVGAEYAVFQDEMTDTGRTGVSIKANALPALRRRFADGDEATIGRVVSLIRRHHAEGCEVFWHLEVLGLHDILTPHRWDELLREGIVPDDGLDKAKGFRSSLVRTLAVGQPGFDGTAGFGGRDWQRLQGRELETPESQAIWALAHPSPDRKLPASVQPEAIAWLQDTLNAEVSREVRIEQGIRLGDTAETGFRIARYRVLRSSYFLKLQRGPGSTGIECRGLSWSGVHTIPPEDLKSVRRVEIASGLEMLSIVPIERPEWAARMAYDRFGLAAEFEIRGVKFVLRWIPPGTFLMGSPGDEPGRDDDEGPQHEVTLTRGFWLGETPVTQGQWRAVVEAAGREAGGLNPSPSHFKGPDELPVEQVSHADCETFCRLMDGVLPKGPGFGLPTEAQWEYACRAGTTTALYTGGITIQGANNAPELDAIAWYGGNSGLGLEVSNPSHSRAGWSETRHPVERAATHRVRLKDPNPWGLYDMLGNVWEWCRDGWGARYRTEAEVDPVNMVKAGAHRVVRGGSWDLQPRYCRAACRHPGDPGYRFHFQGFRLAAGQELRSAEPQGSGATGSGAGEAEPGRRDEARRIGSVLRRGRLEVL